MFVNSYRSSQQLLERKYTDLMMDVLTQSNLRIEEFLEEAKKISLLSSYGLNSYVTAVSQEHYPIQNFLLDTSKENENQATQLLLNYITMKDRAIAIYVYNLNGGDDLYIHPNSPIDYTYDPRGEPWFGEFLASEAYTTDLPPRIDQQVRLSDNWAIYNVRKIFDMENGELLGVMVVSIDIRFIDELNTRMQDSVRQAFTIVDDDSEIIYNADYAQIGDPFGQKFQLAERSGDPARNRQVVEADGEDYIFVSASFETHDWSSYLYIPVNELAVEGDIFKRNLITIVTILVLFALFSSVYLSNVITRPIKTLMKNMSLVEQGKFDNLTDVRSNDEIGLMAVRFQQMSQELKLLVDRIYEEQRAKTEAEIRALQAQINPHFLYNTLNSVKWIATMQRSEKIVEMVESLIALLRYTTRMEQRLVPLREELDYVRHYITIQKVRYFNRIRVTEQVDASLLEQAVLKLTIQPLVENAIFHGVADREGGGQIDISVVRSGEAEMVIAVADNGRGMDEETAARVFRQLNGEEQETGGEGGIGIRNVHTRIQFVFGPDYGVTFTSKPDQGTIFMIRVPLDPEEQGVMTT
ncbi:two-component sensor histidine kinase [Paenibacillus sp. 598K]|uniref:cache domain-containing sensor histidine kinase n=1 Tax=Paenibacillus sp. 598K TaxID=1117987 RepID=UPI000FF915E0|nr:sensor histidine kinase [Paenibacillus sp. 598K]GBF77434.1 two-component sensor histidine kinase [Paenibacillus sp. 598K]